MKKIMLIILVPFVLFACGKSASSPAPESAPVIADSPQETRETVGPEADDVEAAAATPEDTQEAAMGRAIVDAGAVSGYLLPDFDPSWGMARSVYDKAVITMDMKSRAFTNKRYVILIDMNRHSSVRRFYLFDLVSGKVERHNVAHGAGSDPRASGYAKFFSNVSGSDETALGAYRTASTYLGIHGLQLRLDGLENTNSRARDRGIVLHGANYVADGTRAGRSWGCPALDPHVSTSVINRVKGGAMLLIWK